MVAACSRLRPNALQGGQALQHVQEEGAHPAQLAETAFGDGLGPAADQGQHEQEHRPREEKHQRGPGIQRQHEGEDKCRRQSCQQPRRQKLRYVFIQGLHALHGRVHQLPAALPGHVGRSQPEQPGSKLAPQPAFDAAGRPLRHDIAGPDQP